MSSRGLRGHAIERQLAYVRLGVIAINTFVFAVLMDKTRIDGRAAQVAIGLAWAYGIFAWWVRPRLTALVDSLLILLWLYATGGFHSPFYPLLYTSVLATAYRYPPRQTFIGACLYAAGYLGLLFVTGGIEHHTAEVVTRLAFVFLVAWVGSSLSSEVMGALTLQVGLEERQRGETALQSSRKQLAEAQDIAHVGSWEWYPAQRYFTWSDELYRIFGLAPGTEVIYRDFLRRIHDDDMPACRLAIESAYRGESFALEHRILRPSGEVRWVLSRGRPLRGADGRAERLVGTVQDITERREIQERLLASDRLAALGTLAGGVAHEINNPLMYIVGNLDFLENQLTIDGVAPGTVPEFRAALREARHGADRVRRIVQDLKASSRIHGDDGGPGDVRRALEMSANITRNEIRYRAKLSVDLPTLPAVAGSETRLGQVFVNLLVNAAHAIPVGAPDKNEIRVRAWTVRETWVCVEISDTGAGMAPEVKNRIFEPFFTTKPVGSGTGLGLSICHGIVKGLGGDIECDSTPGSGSTFRVLLPCAPGPLPSLEAPSALEGDPSPRRGQVLVIDDDPLVGTAIVRALGRGHDVSLVASGEEALARMKASPEFDLILCDMMMPTSTGLEIYRRICDVAPSAAPTFVLMSGGVYSNEERTFLAESQVPCLDKPLDTRALQDLLRRRLTSSVGSSRPN